MKLNELLLEFKLPKKPKVRPKKTLWFTIPQLWKHDLDTSRPGHKMYYEENEETYYAFDENDQKCYGMWMAKNQTGVTFHSPRPRFASVKRNVKLKPYDLSKQNQ